jgi:hypothetical protein
MVVWDWALRLCLALVLAPVFLIASTRCGPCSPGERPHSTVLYRDAAADGCIAEQWCKHSSTQNTACTETDHRRCCV